MRWWGSSLWNVCSFILPEYTITFRLQQFSCSQPLAPQISLNSLLFEQTGSTILLCNSFHGLIVLVPFNIPLIFQEPAPPPPPPSPPPPHTHTQFDDEWAKYLLRGIDVIRNKNVCTPLVCSKSLSSCKSCVNLISLNASVESWHYCSLTDYQPLLSLPTTGCLCVPMRPNHLH